MAIEQLDDEQIRTWTLEQKDTWWREKVFKGDMPQLTVRSALTGMLLGGVLSLTNLYVGARTGWTLGVGITAVILAFAAFKVMSTLKLAKEFTLLENNAMQSIATSAGYMTAPMVSSLAAYMMVTEEVLPMWITGVWIIALALLGVLFAFPLKKRFINDEQLPFPEGKAAGIVMDSLHSGDPKEGLFKARLLVITSSAAMVLKILQSEKITNKLYLAWFHIPEFLDEWVYGFWSIRIGNTELRELTIRPDTDFVMMAAGGIMGIRTGTSILIGAITAYAILLPWGIGRGDVHGTVTDGLNHFTFRQITLWLLWGGVAMMTTSSLLAFFSKPKVILSAFTGLFAKRKEKKSADVLADVELPMRVFVIGIPIMGALVVFLGWYFFGIAIWMGAIAIPLIFVFTLIAVNSTGLTSITPTGALAKLTQLTYGGIAPGNITTNLATAGITAEVASSASNLLMDIKPGYMLGGKPRHQAIGHVLGVFAGALASVPVFYLVFLHHGDPAQLATRSYAFPSATVWKAISEVLTGGLDQLEDSAKWCAIGGAILGIVLEAIKIVTKGKFWLSGVGLGLAFVISFNTSLAMFLGSFFFWVMHVAFEKKKGSWARRVFVDNVEVLCAGVIAGGALTGIAVILVENFVLPR